MTYQLAMRDSLYGAGMALQESGLKYRVLAPPHYQGGRRDRAGMREASTSLHRGRMPKGKAMRTTVILTIEVHPSSVPMIGQLVDSGVIAAAMPVCKGGR